MEIFLRGKGLLGYLDGPLDFRSEAEPIQATNNDDVRKRLMMISYIMIKISPSRKVAILKMWYPKEVWDKLRSTNKMVSESSIDAKLSVLQDVVLELSESVVELSNKIESLVN